MMITRRDLFVAGAAVLFTLSAVNVGRTQNKVMGSSIFDWNSFEANKTNFGARREVLKAQTATLDELECHITTLNPGASPHEPHKHPAEEVIIVKEGTVESLVNGQLKVVGPGSVIFQASNQMHTIRNVGKTPATYHVFQWHSPGMKPQAK